MDESSYQTEDGGKWAHTTPYLGNTAVEGVSVVVLCLPLSSEEVTAKWRYLLT